MTTSSEGLKEFFRTIWKDTDGWVYVPSKGKDGDWTKTFFHWPEQEAQVVSSVLNKSAVGSEVYYSPALYSRRIPEKQYVLGTHTLWADFDGNAPATWEPSETPSVRVQSSASENQHCYWVLEEFLTDIPTIENRNRTIAIELQADTSGWDANQLLRPPYTTNYGYMKPDRRGQKFDVIIEEMSDRRFKIEAFKPTKDFIPLMMDNLGDIPKIDSVLTELSWPKEFLPLFEKSADELIPKNGERGKRSDALQQLAYIVAESNGTDEQIYSVIADANERWGKYPTSRTDRHKRLVDHVERARSKHPFADTSAFAGLLGTKVAAPTKLVWTLEEFLAADVKIQWLMTDLMSVGGFGFIFGPPGVGKTQVGIRMAFALCAGKPFLNWDNPYGPSKVLFLSLEMNHPSLKYFMDIMMGDAPDRDKINENLIIYPTTSELPLDTPEGKKWFEFLLEEQKPQVLFIDSLSKLSMRDLNDNIAAREIISYLDKIRARFGVSIFLVHHDNKGKNREHFSQDDMYGSRFLSSGADFVLAVSKAEPNDPNLLTVASAKIRMGMPKPDFYIERTPDLNFVEAMDDDLLKDNKGRVSSKPLDRFTGLFDPNSGRN